VRPAVSCYWSPPSSLATNTTGPGIDVHRVMYLYTVMQRERETSSAAFIIIIIIIIILCGARPVHFYTSLNTLCRTHNEDDCWLLIHNVIVVVGKNFFSEFLLYIDPNDRVRCVGDACTKRTIEKRSLFVCACACVRIVSIAHTKTFLSPI